MADEQADWIVIDLSVAIVHIFSPSARRSYDLDGRLGGESVSGGDSEGYIPGESLEDDRAVLAELARSMPRKVAKHPMRMVDESGTSARSLGGHCGVDGAVEVMPAGRGRGRPEVVGGSGGEHNPFLH